MNDSGTLGLANSTIRDNTATNGGGIYIDNSGTLNLNTSTISGNTAGNGGDGGGIFNGTSGTVNGTSSTIDDTGQQNAAAFITRHIPLNNTGPSKQRGQGGGIYKISSPHSIQLVALNRQPTVRTARSGSSGRLHRQLQHVGTPTAARVAAPSIGQPSSD